MSELRKGIGHERLVRAKEGGSLAFSLSSRLFFQGPRLHTLLMIAAKPTKLEETGPMLKLILSAVFSISSRLRSSKSSAASLDQSMKATGHYRSPPRQGGDYLIRVAPRKGGWGGRHQPAPHDIYHQISHPIRRTGRRSGRAGLSRPPASSPAPRTAPGLRGTWAAEAPSGRGGPCPTRRRREGRGDRGLEGRASIARAIDAGDKKARGVRGG